MVNSQSEFRCPVAFFASLPMNQKHSKYFNIKSLLNLSQFTLKYVFQQFLSILKRALTRINQQNRKRQKWKEKSIKMIKEYKKKVKNVNLLIFIILLNMYNYQMTSLQDTEKNSISYWQPKRKNFRNIPQRMTELLGFMEEQIQRSQRKKKKFFSFCFDSYKRELKRFEYFSKFFNKLSLQEKLEYYCLFLKNLDEFQKSSRIYCSLGGQNLHQASYNLHISIQGQRLGTFSTNIKRSVLQVKQLNIRVDLSNYMIRKSRKSASTFIIQAIQMAWPKRIELQLSQKQDQSALIKTFYNQKKQSVRILVEKQLQSSGILIKQKTQATKGSETNILDEKPQEKDENQDKNQDENLSCIINGQQFFYSIKDLTQIQYSWVQHQKQEKKDVQFKLNHPQEIKQGISFCQNKFLKLPNKYRVQPTVSSSVILQNTYKNLVLKNDCVLRERGGVKLTNKQKLKNQSEVLKFFLSRIKENLMNGEGIFNVSLPVSIFSNMSHLQRCCYALGMAPKILQPVALSQDKLLRFKMSIIFGITNGILFFDTDKSFNPILGETYQGFIRGCPVYAEQISHHPPISSLFMKGRGYTITGTLQSKAYIRLNSGGGYSDDFKNIIFDDGSKISYQAFKQQVEGINFGQKIYKLGGTVLFIDRKQCLFCAVKVLDGDKLFSRNTLLDQLKGEIYRVKPEFIERLFKFGQWKKRESPKENEILQKLGTVSGRWTKQLRIDGKVYYVVEKDLPDKLINEPSPLLSDSNFRKDIINKKNNDLEKSQTEKEILQNRQRNDRKLRQKFTIKRI